MFKAWYIVPTIKNGKAVAGIRAYSTIVCFEKTADKVFSFPTEFSNYFTRNHPVF